LTIFACDKITLTFHNKIIMLVINTTYHVSKLIEEDWTKWVKEEYIPKVTKSGILVRPRFMKVFMDNDNNSNSYALQFEVDSFNMLEYWSDNHGKKLRTDMSDLFMEKVVGFTTVMEVLENM
jgi:hypothetical protein